MENEIKKVQNPQGGYMSRKQALDILALLAPVITKIKFDKFLQMYVNEDLCMTYTQKNVDDINLSIETLIKISAGK